MIRTITVNDDEDTSELLIQINDAHSGVEVTAEDMFGNSVFMIFDAKLMKKFCQVVASSIEGRAQMRNYCGEVTNEYVAVQVYQR